MSNILLINDSPLGRRGLTNPSTVERVAEARLPTDFGEFRIIGYRSLTSNEEFVALVHGDLRQERAPLVRIHSQCLTGDVFGSVKCDCGPHLRAAMKLIESEGCGAIRRPSRRWTFRSESERAGEEGLS